VREECIETEDFQDCVNQNALVRHQLTECQDELYKQRMMQIQ